jgi:heme-degrading monooxygenase HmoA
MMVTEVAILKIDPANASAFEQMYEEVVPVLRRQAGYQSDKLLRAIERPEEYILSVEWDSVDAHQAFIDSDEYSLMAEPFGGFVVDSGFAHYNTISAS